MTWWTDDRHLYYEQQRLDAEQERAAIAIAARKAVTTQGVEPIDLSPAKGIRNGLIIAIPFWAAVVAGVLWATLA